MSNALSNQLFVRDRVGYDEVYPSGHKDLDSPSEERSSSTTSLSSRDEGLEMDRPEEDSVMVWTMLSPQSNPLWVLMDLGSSSCYPYG